MFANGDVDIDGLIVISKRIPTRSRLYRLLSAKARDIS
jgi:hypothetical protein